MSIQAQIDRIKENVSSAFAAVAEKGGTVSDHKSDNLAKAIASIPASDGMYAFYIDENGHLILLHDTIEPPQYEVDSRGHLLYTYMGRTPMLSINSNGHLIYTLGG